MSDEYEVPYGSILVNEEDYISQEAYNNIVTERDKFQALYKEAVAKYTELVGHHAHLITLMEIEAKYGNGRGG